MTIHVELFGFEMHFELGRKASPEQDQEQGLPSMEATSGGQFERSDPAWPSVEEFGFITGRSRG